MSTPKTEPRHFGVWGFSLSFHSLPIGRGHSATLGIDKASALLSIRGTLSLASVRSNAASCTFAAYPHPSLAGHLVVVLIFIYRSTLGLPLARCS